MVVEHFVAGLVDRLRLCTLILLASINWAKLAVPDTEAALIHPLALLLVASPETALLVWSASVNLGSAREAEDGVVVDGISSVIPVLVGITELREVRREGVAVKEDDVIGILCTNGSMDFVVEFDEAVVLLIGRLVEGIVASDPLVALVVLGEFCPQPEDTFLEVPVVPDCKQPY